MRDRLVAALVGMTVAVVALYGIPRAYFLADLVNTNETSSVERAADLLAVVVTERGQDAAPVTEEFLAPLLREGEAVEVRGADGSVVRAGSAVAGDDVEDIVVERPLPDGGSITLARSHALVGERVSAALLPLVLIGLGLTVVAAVAAFFLARRMARPFRELAGAAEAIGQGRFDVPVAHSSVPEAEAIGEALRRGSAQLDSLVTREREFAVNASHELRSPITALRLEIEDLAMWPQTPPDVAAELNGYLPELDRLSAAITHFLDTARAERLRSAGEVDLSTLVTAAADRWGPRLEDLGGGLTVEASDTARVRLTPGVGGQLLDLLIEDVVDGGARGVTLSTGVSDTFVRVSIVGAATAGPLSADAGATVTEDPDAGPAGDRRARAVSLAQSVGGHVRVEDTRRAVSLTLPIVGTGAGD